MNAFLLDVEKTHWTIDRVEQLYTDNRSVNFFKELFNAYRIVEKRDFKRESQFIKETSPQMFPSPRMKGRYRYLF